MADTQIVNSKTAAAPSTYTLPSGASFVLKAVNATFTDNGAAGDWLPAVVIFSDSGHVVARAADQAVLVLGGDDAEVSWFPGVKNAGAGFEGLPEAIAYDPIPASLYPSGAVITPAWSAAAMSGSTFPVNSGFHFTPNGGNYDLRVTKLAAYAYTVKVEWAASFAGDRYVELNVAQGTPMPQRFRQSGTPEGDVMILSGIFDHGSFTEHVMAVSVLQNSGADQGVNQITLMAVELPIGP